MQTAAATIEATTASTIKANITITKPGTATLAVTVATAATVVTTTLFSLKVASAFTTVMGLVIFTQLLTRHLNILKN
jgi:hypothetical protein